MSTVTDPTAMGLALSALPWVGVPIGSIIVTGLSLYGASAQDVIGTFCQEGTCKSVEYMGDFSHVVMAKAGYKFRGDTKIRQVSTSVDWEEPRKQTFHVEKDDEVKKRLGNQKLTKKELGQNRLTIENLDPAGNSMPEKEAAVKARLDPHPWDIIRTDEQPSTGQQLLGGWRPVGFPGLHKVKRFEIKPLANQEEESSTEPKKVVVAPCSFFQKFISLQDQVVVIVVGEAETSDNPTVKIRATLSYRVVNPWRFSYASKDGWLKMAETDLHPAIRELVSNTTFQDALLIKNAEVTGQGFVDIRDDVRRKYGVEIFKILIANIKPDGEEAEENVKLSNLNVRAELERKSLKEAEKGAAERLKIKAKAERFAREQQAEGEAAFIRKSMTELNNKPPHVTRAYAIMHTDVTTLVEGGANTSVAISPGNPGGHQGHGPTSGGNTGSGPRPGPTPRSGSGARSSGGGGKPSSQKPKFGPGSGGGGKPPQGGW